MTNGERQKALDKKKYGASTMLERDMSGEMPYCDFCMCQAVSGNEKTCNSTQENREQFLWCAKAYNRMKRQ